MLNLQGKITKETRDWLIKRVPIKSWDIELPEIANYKASDNLIYPANAAYISTPSKYKIEQRYIGSVCISEFAINLKFRYLSNKYKTYTSLPLIEIQNFYNYLSTVLSRDCKKINYNILSLTPNTDKAVQVESIEGAFQGQKDWLVTLNFKYDIEFVCFPDTGIYNEQFTGSDRVNFSNVVSTYDQITAPKATDNPDIKEVWTINQILFELDITRLNNTPTTLQYNIERTN